MRSLQSQPNRLNSRKVFPIRTIYPTAQLADQANHLLQSGRLLWRAAAFDHHVDCLPFLRFKDRLTIDVRATPPHSTDHQGAPGDDYVNRQAGQEPLEVLKPPGLHAAARFVF